MLLDFERDVSQMFDPEADVLTEKGIDLGINSRDIEYKNDAGNRYFGFALNGTLWLFDSSASRVTQVGLRRVVLMCGTPTARMTSRLSILMKMETCTS